MAYIDNEMTCIGCGTVWSDGQYCPECEDEFEAILACPWCGQPSLDPGALCPPCEELHEEHCRDD